MKGAYPIIVRRLTALAGGPVLVLALGAPLARGAAILPSGASVAAGQASVAAPGETGLRITQSSQKALINWQSFSIGAGSNVTFQQPNSAAITLNRVVGTDASAINGNLFANGQVWLINGNGILFGRGSRIDVGGLIATTSDMRDADFLAGKYDFGIASGNKNAAVVNQGSIKAATGGSAVLSGARVANDGVIEVNLGKVVLAGASAFSVDFDGDSLIRFAIAAPVTETPNDANGAPVPALVSNSGTIAAEGGKILLTARAARSVVNNVINTTGIIEANSASMQNGEIVLDAGEGGTASVAGILEASGKNTGQTGGAIALLADTVTVADGAKLEASGDSGGGTILIGGNLHGTGPEPNARAVNVGEAVIAADAGSNGNGGTVAIYSVGETNVAGSISAKGGAGGGDGGVVETSGHDLHIAQSTYVDTSASAGAAGSWLLDPLNINVALGGTSVLNGGLLTLNGTSDAPFTVAPTTIINALATTNVRLEANQDISVIDPVKYTSVNSLTFLAKRNVTLKASVQNDGTGAIFAVAGWNGLTASASILATPGAYGGNGGSVLIGGANAPGGVAVGSMGGTTIVAAHNLAMDAVNGYAQLGYHGDAGGDIVVNLTGNLALTGGNTSGLFAQIGHGGYLSQGSNSATITATVSGDVTLTRGQGFAAYAQIGNGGYGVVGDQSGNIALTAGGGLVLTGGPSTDAYALIGNGGAFGSGNRNGDIAAFAGSGVTLNNAQIGDDAGSTGGTVLVTSGGNLTLTGGASINAYGSGDALVLAAAGDFINQAGGAALNVSGGGRWLTFLSSPANNIAGGLSASPFYNRSFDFLTGSYAAIGTSGNRFVYALAPTLNVTLDNKVKTYGSANPTFTTTITGLLGGDTLTGAVTGTPLLSTTATANSAVGNYPIIGTLGTLTSDFNYGFQFANGTLRIDPATLTYTANAASRTYGSVNPNLSGSITGFVNGETQTTATGGTLAFASPATAASHVGTYAINGSGLTANNGNYNFAQAAGNAAALTIDPATLTAGLTGSVTKTYDGTDIATLASVNYTLAGAVSGDSVALNNPVSGNYDDKDAGSGKLVTVSGLALSGADVGNYVLASTQVSGAVGIITLPVIDNGILANLIGRPNTNNAPLAAAPADATAIMGAVDMGVSDATSSTTSATSEESAPANAVANNVGQSLSGAAGSVPSWTNVLIQGLLRQFDPPPGASRPRAVPSVDQIYSSWGNEAFWQ